MIATGPVGWFRTSARGKTHSASADTIAHGLKNLLGVATEATDASPPLKSVLGGLRTLIKAYESMPQSEGPCSEGVTAIFE